MSAAITMRLMTAVVLLVQHVRMPRVVCCHGIDLHGCVLNLSCHMCLICLIAQDSDPQCQLSINICINFCTMPREAACGLMPFNNLVNNCKES